MSSALRPAVFLDRDGVIIENRDGYVRQMDNVAFIPGALEAIVRLRATPYRIVIATNQSPVGRGLMALESLQAINRHIVAAIEGAGGGLDGVYVCPHTPEDGCDCRKPRPGLLLQASRELGIDLHRSVMIGDALSDVQAGLAAGARSLLVLTGRGAEQAKMHEANGLEELRTFADLPAAIGWLLDNPYQPALNSLPGPTRVSM